MSLLANFGNYPKETFKYNQDKISLMAVSKKEHEKLKKWFEEEIKRRDRKIDELEEQNKLLLKSALKQSEKAAKWQEMFIEQRKKNK